MSSIRINKRILALVLSCVLCLAAGALLYHLVSGSSDAGPSKAGENRAETNKAGENRAETTGADSSVDSQSKRKNRNSDAAADTGLIVCIETGHGREDNGNWDAGCSWSDGETTYEEATVMIPIAKAMAKYMRASGVKVVTDADSDNNRNLIDTLDYLDEHPEVDAFINIHCDWENAASGTMPLYRTDEQLKLAQALNKGVHSVLDIPDRGETARNDLDTLNSEKVHCPAVLFETGSIKDDNEILTKKYDAYGKGLAIGMCDFLGVDFREK